MMKSFLPSACVCENVCVSTLQSVFPEMVISGEGL